jgi:hypothetical protein
MKCCKLMNDGVAETLPFERTIATGYYDGPTDGFTECFQCNQVYSFRKLDWDDAQDVRVFGLSPLGVNLESIATRLGVKLQPSSRMPLVPPLDELKDRLVNELFSQPPILAVVVEEWPGQSSFWRDISGMDLSSVTDWFSILGIPKRGIADSR